MPHLKPLPECEGPKLEPFTDDLLAHNVEILEATSRFTDCVHGMVYKVRIDGRMYALKCFYPGAALNMETCFPTEGKSCGPHFKPGSPIDELLPNPRFTKASALEGVDRELLCQHMDAFSAECRAFGRLKELGKEDLAVRVHGYVCLYSNDETFELFRDIIEKEEKRCFQDNSKESRACRVSRELGDYRDRVEEPVMAIVKEWIESDENSKDELKSLKYFLAWGRHFERIHRNLEELHKCGIVNRDISDRQYVNGILVDMSCAWTVPHIFGP